MARPTKAEHERRQERVEVRLTTGERVHLDEAARSFGITVAEFVRRRALGYRLPAVLTESPVRAAIATALIRLGVNLNQLVKAFHRSGVVSPELPPLIAKIDGELDRLYGAETDERGPQL